MLPIKKPLFFLLLIVSSHLLYAQQYNLTDEDKEAIKYKSQDFIGEYANLLNLIKDPSIEAVKRMEIIRNSYSISANQIFLDEKVIIEDDIDPNFFDWTTQKNSEVPKYLYDLDLFYEKSEEATIIIDNIETYDVSQKDYIFLPVYFETTYRGKHGVINKPYKKLKRIATIKAEKENNLWRPLIVSIVFYNPNIHTFVEEAKKTKQQTGIIASDIFNPLNEGNEDNPVTEEKVISEETITNEITPENTVTVPDKSETIFTSFPTVARKGKTQFIKWQKGEWEENTKLELYKNTSLINVLDISTNAENYLWSIPSNLELGENYSLKLTSVEDKQKAIFSPEFKVKRGFPLGIKILGAGALVGTAVFLLTSGGDNGTGTTNNPVIPPTAEDLDPPFDVPADPGG